MTAPSRALSSDDDVMAAYAAHVAGLAIGDSSGHARHLAARRFLERHPDLGAWMDRPTPARVADLHRMKAWPFVVWAAVAGRLQVDVELLLAKPGGVDLSIVWERLHPGEIERAEAVGRDLGWSDNWVRQVARHSLPVVCTWALKGLDHLNDDDLERFRAEVEASSSMTESARTRARSRLFAVAQICFQLGSAANPPRRSVTERARTPPELAARVAQPAMARELVRYAETIGTVLRPASAYTRVKAVRVFCDWLAENHSEVRRLDQLERSAHVEPFLAWAAIGPGGARTAEAGGSRSRSSTTTSSTCGSSSRTSRHGVGPPARRGVCCFSPTSRGCPSPCPGRCRRWTTPPSWPP